MKTPNMPNRFLRCAASATASLTFLAMIAFAQTKSPLPSDFSPSLNGPVKDRPQPAVPQGPTPHTPDGKPDLSGAWAPNAIRQNVDLRASVREIGGVIPFQPWAETLYLERKTNLSKDDPESRCMPPGVPRMTTTPYPFRIVETPKLIIILYEGGAHARLAANLHGRASASGGPNPTWLGDSIGHWEGDTLVVDSVGFNGEAWLDESGLPTTQSLHVIERFRRPDLGHLEIENIVDDPKAYTKSWSFTTHPVALKGDLMEYICQENNKDVQHLVGKN